MGAEGYFMGGGGATAGAGFLVPAEGAGLAALAAAAALAPLGTTCGGSIMQGAAAGFVEVLAPGTA
jgi:hypothetical protein